MDGLYEYIKDKNVSNEEITKIKDIVYSEEYDTESVEMDIFKIDNNKDSNIRQWLNNDIYSDLIKQYIYKIKR